MKIRVGTVLGLGLVVLGAVVMLTVSGLGGVVPVAIGLGLMFTSWHGGRVGTIVFGHISIVLGCYLITWGIYLLPYSEPTIKDIFLRPLFWGMFSVMGGICANYHGFCGCVRGRQADLDVTKSSSRCDAKSQCPAAGN
jgi:hypothetical protein